MIGTFLTACHGLNSVYWDGQEGTTEKKIWRGYQLDLDKDEVICNVRKFEEGQRTSLKKKKFIAYLTGGE